MDQVDNHEKVISMERLRAAVLTDIERQEHIVKRQEQIMKRVTISAVTIFIVLVTLLGFIIYAVSKPIPANEVTLKYIQVLDSSILEQEKLITLDREDVRAAREEVIKMQQQVLQMQQELLKDDSVHHDSKLYLKK